VSAQFIYINIYWIFPDILNCARTAGTIQNGLYKLGDSDERLDI